MSKDSVWIRDDEMIVYKFFVEEHTEGKCIPRWKITQVLEEYKKNWDNGNVLSPNELKKLFTE